MDRPDKNLPFIAEPRKVKYTVEKTLARSDWELLAIVFGFDTLHLSEAKRIQA